MKDWVCSYRLDGDEWAIILRADDAADASRRMRAIGMTGQVDGELVATIPGWVPPVLVGTVVFIRNLFAR